MGNTIETSPIKKLSKRSFKANKSRNLIAITAIIMTAVMFTTIFTVGFSMVQSMEQLGTSVGVGVQGAFIVVSAIIMILISGYLIIFNIFQISVSQDIHFYGLLKTLGATKRQIRKLFVSQAMRMWLIGMPIGLLIGYGIGALIMPMVLVSLGASAQLSMNPLIFLAAALFTLITVLFSCAKPSGIAGKVSPVAAMKYVDSDMGKRAKDKQTNHHFSMQSMAFENMKRDPRRTVVVVISIAVGFVLMNSLYVMQHSYDKETYVNNFINSDIVVSTSAIDRAIYNSDEMEKGGFTQEMIENITQMKGLTSWGAMYYTETQEKLNEDVTSRMITYYDDEEGGQSWWVNDNADAARQYADVKKKGETTVSIYGLDSFTAPMGKYFVGEYDDQKFASGNYVIAMAIADNGEGSIHYAIGDKINIAGKAYEIMAIMEPTETLKGMLHSKENELEIDFAIHTSVFIQSFQNVLPNSLFMDIVDVDKQNSIVSSLEQQYPDVTIVTPLSYEVKFQGQVMAQVIMGYALGFVMALIGILNFINTMLTSIIARKREFAMLESVGMTKAQLKKMLVCEGMNYAVSSLVISLILSALVSLTVIQEIVSTSWAASFNFTLLPFAIIIPLIVVLAVLIPLVCLKETQKKSLVERLRETTA